MENVRGKMYNVNDKIPLANSNDVWDKNISIIKNYKNGKCKRENV